MTAVCWATEHMPPELMRGTQLLIWKNKPVSKEDRNAYRPITLDAVEKKLLRSIATLTRKPRYHGGIEAFTSLSSSLSPLTPIFIEKAVPFGS